MRGQEELRCVRSLWRRTAGERPVEGAERYVRAWEALELPEPAPPPPDFAACVAARAASERVLLPGFALSPRWAAVAAALILAVGVAGGAGLGVYALDGSSDESAERVELFDDGGLLDDLFVGGGSAASAAAEEVAP